MKVLLTSEEVEYIIQHLDYEISENEDMIKNSKTERKEKFLFLEENKFIQRLKEKLLSKQQEFTAVIQGLSGLTAQQEDYVLEAGLERYREARDSQEERQKAINKMCEDLEK